MLCSATHVILDYHLADSHLPSVGTYLFQGAMFVKNGDGGTRAFLSLT